MSYIITPFEVSSKALGNPVKAHFVHLIPGIATRHSDTIDCFFRVEGEQVTVAISCPAITAIRTHDARQLTDQELAEVAALFLRRTLAQGYDPAQTELFIDESKLRALAEELGFLNARRK